MVIWFFINFATVLRLAVMIQTSQLFLGFFIVVVVWCTDLVLLHAYSMIMHSVFTKDNTTYDYLPNKTEWYECHVDINFNVWEWMCQAMFMYCCWCEMYLKLHLFYDFDFTVIFFVNYWSCVGITQISENKGNNLPAGKGQRWKGEEVRGRRGRGRTWGGGRRVKKGNRKSEEREKERQLLTVKVDVKLMLVTQRLWEWLCR